eukprot:scaffold31138_cov58-Attheya_sp.AAC.4
MTTVVAIDIPHTERWPIRTMPRQHFLDCVTEKSSLENTQHFVLLVAVLLRFPIVRQLRRPDAVVFVS